MKERNFLILIVVCATIAIAALFTAQMVSSRTTNAVLMKDHVAQSTCLDFGTSSISNETATSVTTKCAIVDVCLATTDTQASTPATDIICNVPTQSSTNKGLVTITPDTVGGTASGTTKVNYVVIGYGRKGI